jgi:hypothetical protein
VRLGDLATDAIQIERADLLDQRSSCAGDSAPACSNKRAHAIRGASLAKPPDLRAIGRPAGHERL